ncbi:hypothetical protein SH2C18_13660 [Clostridium sediminicola]|uniref:SHOCT domain-containing protein n=1 Tax=Clostridium sediminicola TaxID=3114879 RepID=UPI0031F20D5E
MMIFIWLAVGFLVYSLVTNNDSKNLYRSDSKSPEDILRERFVKGEIDEETYKKMMQTLKR